MKEQQDLFERGAKLAILNRVAAQNVLTPRMLAVLRAIDDRARDQAETTLTLSEIGLYLNVSRATAKRGVADLVRNQLLAKTETKTAAGKQANRYQIIWSALRAIGDGEAFDLRPKNRGAESTQVVKAATVQNRVDPGHHDPSDGSPCTPDPGHSDPSLLIALSRINNTSTSLGSDWEGEEEELSGLGVVAAGAAIAKAREHGCTADDVRRLLDQVRRKPGAWGPGAIYDRISRARPGEDPAAGWPAESADWQRRQQQARQAADREQAAQQAIAQRAERRARREAARQLEADFGPQLDALSPDEQLDFARENCPDLVPHLRRDPQYASAGLFRGVLLAALKNRFESEVSQAEGVS